MDILLIDPPYISLKGMSIERGYHVGLTGLAAYLREGGMETAVLSGDLLMGLPAHVLLLNANVRKYAAGQQQYGQIINDKNHFVWKNMADIVRRTNPKLVGISYLTPLRYSVERIAGLVKEIDPRIKVVVGSFHPTFCADDVMQNRDVDFVIRGEGEIPLLSLAQESRKDNPQWETVPGIYYRDSGGQVRRNHDVLPIENLDALPFPARDLVLNCDFNSHRVHSVATARGCPYTCTFCSDRRFWGGKVRRRNVGNVIEEMQLLRKTYRRIDYVDIIDGTFTFDRKYVEAFCNAMTAQKIDLKWRCTARYDNLDEDLLRTMKRAGCCGLYLGLESGSARVLKAIDKKITLEKIVNVSGMVYRSGIASATSVLLGLPEETREDMAETLQLMRKIKTDVFDVNSYIPLPGTPLYDGMSAADRQNIDWRRVSYKSLENYFAKQMPPDEFNGYLSEAYRLANSVRRKTLLRFALRRLLPFI
ncbi:MAG: radical SAM protein [Dehalococcoidales bacterium]|nr:radical SAM protein [Dehalococcoidales bacterium]